MSVKESENTQYGLKTITTATATMLPLYGVCRRQQRLESVYSNQS